MCESVKKFGSKRPGILSDGRDSLPPEQYSLTINMLHINIGGYYLSNDGVNLLSEYLKDCVMTAKPEYRLQKAFPLNDNPIFSDILDTSKPWLAARFERNKTLMNTVDIGNKISFSQVL